MAGRQGERTVSGDSAKLSLQNLSRHRWVVLGCAWILGAVMAGAAWSKIADPPGFAQSLHAYRLLPAALLAPLALFLPWLEALVGLALLLGPARRGGAAITLALMVVFLGALGINRLRGNPVDCGCFGNSKIQKSRDERLRDMDWAMLRDVGLALLAVNVLRNRKSDR
jgi:uncharacterized membrane protein YphA (DoxX/SURF4 family)